MSVDESALCAREPDDERNCALSHRLIRLMGMVFPKEFCQLSLWRQYETYKAFLLEEMGVKVKFSGCTLAFRFANEQGPVSSVFSCNFRK